MTYVVTIGLSISFLENILEVSGEQASQGWLNIYESPLKPNLFFGVRCKSCIIQQIHH
jgi:hypothetical protein